MTREEYERAKQHIESERQAALKLMETAYGAQLRALELVWSTHGQGSFTPAILRREPEPPPPPSPASERARRRASRLSPEELENRIVQALGQLPDPFDRNDVGKALGLRLDRGLLYRALQNLAGNGAIEILSRGVGRRAALYRKTEHNGPPIEHSEVPPEHSEVLSEHKEVPTEHSEDVTEHS